MEYQAIWLYKMFSEFKHEQKKKNPIKILCNNNSIIALTRNLMVHILENQA